MIALCYFPLGPISQPPEMTHQEFVAVKASIYPDVDVWGFGDDRNGPGMLEREARKRGWLQNDGR